MKNIIHFFATIFLLAGVFTSSQAQQQDLPFEGMWRGLLSQEGVGNMSDIILKLYYETDSTLFGTSKIVSPRGDFVEYYVEGSFDSNSVHFYDVHLLKESRESMFDSRGMKEYQAEFSAENDKWMMTGIWEEITDSTSNMDESYIHPEGRYRLTKVRGFANQSEKSSEKVRFFQGRLVEVQEVFEVSSDTIQLFVIDNNQLDQDSVTIFYDKKLLAKQHELTYTPLELEIVVSSTQEHLLILYANNTGAIPPNTAAVYFFEDGQRREISIRSDMSKSAGVIFRKK